MRSPSFMSFGFGEKEFVNFGFPRARGMFSSRAIWTCLLRSSCCITIRGSSWMLNARSISGRYLMKFLSIMGVASLCHWYISPPPSMSVTWPLRMRTEIRALSKPIASRTLSLMTEGSRAQKGISCWWIVSYSSMSSTPLFFANLNHLSKFGGGGIPYRLRYSATASSNVLDCRALTALKSASFFEMSWWMGCDFAVAGTFSLPSSSSPSAAGG